MLQEYARYVVLPQPWQNFNIPSLLIHKIKIIASICRTNYHITKVYVVCVLNYIMDTSHPQKFRWDIVRMDRELKIP